MCAFWSSHSKGKCFLCFSPSPPLSLFNPNLVFKQQFKPCVCQEYFPSRFGKIRQIGQLVKKREQKPGLRHISVSSLSSSPPYFVRVLFHHSLDIDKHRYNEKRNCFFVFFRHKFAIDTFSPYTSPRQYLHAFVKQKNRMETHLRVFYA